MSIYIDKQHIEKYIDEKYGKLENDIKKISKEMLVESFRITIN